MNIPVAVTNIVVGLFAEDSVEAEAHIQSICEHFTALSQGTVTVPSQFDSDTFPGVTWQDGTIHLQFVRCVLGGTVPGNSTPLDLVLNVVHCGALKRSLLDLHLELCSLLQAADSARQVPVETLGFYPSDVQLGDTDVASNRALHLVLEGQEQMACEILLANSVTAVLEAGVARVASMQGRTGIQAHNLLATAQSGALPHLLDGRAVAGAAALCCTAASACIAMDDCGSAADYALIGQRLIDTSLRDIALGAADLLETNRLSVQCALSLGSAAWLSVAPQTTPQARQRSGSPRRSSSLHGHSVRRWMAAADAFEQGAVSAGSVAQADPHARMLLSPLPPWAHAALMFASAGVAYNIAAQTMLDGAAARPMPSESTPAALLSPSKASQGAAAEEPWAAARQAQTALQQAASFASSSLAVYTSPAPASSDRGELPPQLALAADVAMRVAATTVCCLATADNLLCRAPRRALGVFTSLVRDLSRAGAARHAVVLSAAGLALGAPAQAARLAALLKQQPQTPATHAEDSIAGGAAAPPASSSSPESAASSVEGCGGGMRMHTGPQQRDHDIPAGFAGVRASASAKRTTQQRQPGARSHATSMRPALHCSLWSIHTQDLFGSLASSLLALGYSRAVAELSLIWGDSMPEVEAPSGEAAHVAGSLCDPLTTHTLLDVLLDPQRALEHCMHVHTLQACLHGTPYMLDFAMSLRLSHFLEPQTGAARPQTQRPWSTEAAWTSFLTESVQRAAAELPEEGSLLVSSIPGATIPSAHWLPREMQEEYHAIPTTQQQQLRSDNSIANQEPAQSAAFHSPGLGARTRRVGRRRTSTATHTQPQMTETLASKHDILQVCIDVEVGGVLAALLAHQPGQPGQRELRLSALQCKGGPLRLLKPTDPVSHSTTITATVLGADICSVCQDGSAVLTGAWFEARGMCWLQPLPLPLAVQSVQPLPLFFPRKVFATSAIDQLIYPVDIQCFDSSELQIQGMHAALCSSWQAQSLVENGTPLAPESYIDCTINDSLQHDGQVPAAGPLSGVTAHLSDGSLRLVLRAASVAASAAQLQVGVGDELRLILWVWCAYQGHASGPQMCRRLVLPVTVPPAAEAWQSNQGPWDPDEHARELFWRDAIRISMEPLQCGTIQRVEARLCFVRELVPPGLLIAFDEQLAMECGGEGSGRASCSIHLQHVAADLAWLGCESLQLRRVGEPILLGTLLAGQNGPGPLKEPDAPLTWSIQLSYSGSGKTYSAKFCLAASRLLLGA